jgi:hypothetical protein
MSGIDLICAPCALNFHVHQICSRDFFYVDPFHGFVEASECGIHAFLILDHFRDYHYRKPKLKNNCAH